MYGKKSFFNQSKKGVGVIWIFLKVNPILLLTTYDDLEQPECNMMVDTTWEIVFFLGVMAIFFAVPLLILVILYSVIACNLMASPVIGRGSANHLLKYRKQVVLMLGTVVLFFFFCLIPFRAFTVWIILFATPDSLRALGFERYFCILYFCRFMLYLNSAINPILYNLMSTKFRDGFRRVCRKFCRQIGMKKHRWRSRRLNRNNRSTITTTTTRSSSGRTGTSTSFTHTTTSSMNSNVKNQPHSTLQRTNNKSVKLPELQRSSAADLKITSTLFTTTTNEPVPNRRKESYV